MTTQTHPSAASIRPVAIAIGVGVGAAVLASVVLLGGFDGRGSGSAVAVIPPASPSPTVPGATQVPAVTPAVSPAATPIATPVVSPTIWDAPVVTSAPDGGTDAMPITIELENATGADVRVDIVDQTGLLVGAASGTPGDGASVEPYTLTVVNVDANTLTLSWVDYPIDNALALYIDRSGGGYRLVLVQPEPTGPTDAMAVDRELTLTFSEPISASQVEAFLQDGLDTPG